MKLPFTVEEFLSVFANYNQNVFPIHIVLYLLAATAIYLTVAHGSWTNKVISGILSFLWLWMGIVYHFIHFTSINKAAYFFGGLFVLQGALFLWKGVYKNQLNFRFTKDRYGLIGIVLLAFALVLYPAISYSMGHIYPATPTFGLPCPTTIFTFGMFSLLDKKYPRIILVIPTLWALIGFTAAFSLGIKEDISLLAAALISLLVLMLKHKKIEISAI